MLVASPLDLQKNELRQAQIQNLASAPGSPVKGQLYYDTSSNKLFWWNGTAWVDATGGTLATPQATASVQGTIQLAGDLTGTATAPVVAPLAITDAKVAAANKDGIAATPSLRTLGSGAQQAMRGNAGLDVVAANIMGGNMPMQNFRITNLGDPTSSLDGANKAYVDNVAQGLDAKASVKAAFPPSTNFGVMSGLVVVDGYQTVNGDRILLTGQTTPASNGIYIASSGGWTRAPDADTWAELPGAFVFVEQGTVMADTGWVCTSDQGGTLGTTAVTWAQFSGAGTYLASNGIVKTGNTFSANPDLQTLDTGGAGNSIRIIPGSLDLSGGLFNTSPVPVSKGGSGQTTAKASRETGLGAAGYYSSATHGAGTTIAITQATHGLRASRGLMVQVRIEATGEEVVADNTVAANGDVTVTFAASQSANTIRVIIIG